jgi:hypothetical protein
MISVTNGIWVTFEDVYIDELEAMDALDYHALKYLFDVGYHPSCTRLVLL